jgi:hypothetical protein
MINVLYHLRLSQFQSSDQSAVLVVVVVVVVRPKDFDGEEAIAVRPVRSAAASIHLSNFSLIKNKSAS